jgi:UDP-N-acetylmuramate dehydrogenase
MEVFENVSLKLHNTFGLDAKARWYSEIYTIQDIQQLMNDNRFKSIPKMVLGGGSNVLFTGDFNGLIIHNKIDYVKKVKENDNQVIVEAGAGMNWHSFVLYTLENNYPGLENLSLIPGSVGAAPIQNIGAYGVEMKNNFQELNAFDLESGFIKNFKAEECRFGYRDSIFKREAKNRYVITDVTFRFNKKSDLNTSYGAIREQLNTDQIQQPTIRDVSNAVIKIRKSKLPDPAIIGNAGSFFKNPEVKSELYQSLKEKFSGIVGYDSGNGNVKLAAGWLIEQCGWKGKRSGNTGMHAAQALVLVNYGNATGNELITHAKKVQKSVKEKFGVMLEMEVNVI